MTSPDAMLRLILTSRVYEVAHETPLEQWDFLMNVNARSVWRITKTDSSPVR